MGGLDGDEVKELSIFVDESGDFGPYDYLSPYYIVIMVFHDQSADIKANINHLNEKLRQSGLPETPIHTGPLIRREYEYDNYTLIERKRIFNFRRNKSRCFSKLIFKSNKKIPTKPVYEPCGDSFSVVFYSAPTAVRYRYSIDATSALVAGVLGLSKPSVRGKSASMP